MITHEGDKPIVSHNQHEAALFRLSPFEKVLQKMNDQGHFKAAVLTGNDGLPIATVPFSYDKDTTAAMVALLQRVSKEARTQLGMAEVDEVTIFDRDRIRLVCRYLVIDGEELVLAVMVPPNRYHRRLTNQAMREIEAAWRE
jgi:predicted regulator of Ras-like GTPase activity (Roadblock/LC7/MglB family)